MDGDVQRRQPGPWRSGSAPRLAQAFVAGLETCPPTSAPILVHLLTDAARRADDWAVFLFVVVMLLVLVSCGSRAVEKCPSKTLLGIWVVSPNCVDASFGHLLTAETAENAEETKRSLRTPRALR